MLTSEEFEMWSALSEREQKALLNYGRFLLFCQTHGLGLLRAIGGRVFKAMYLNL